MLDTSAFLEGLLLGAGLFTSVGPKDAFVIKRSLSSPHLLSIALVCAGSDALLIVLGAHGLSALLSRHAAVVAAALWAGIAYLAGYGLLALRSALANPRGRARCSRPPRFRSSIRMHGSIRCCCSGP